MDFPIDAGMRARPREFFTPKQLLGAANIQDKKLRFLYAVVDPARLYPQLPEIGMSEFGNCLTQSRETTQTVSGLKRILNQQPCWFDLVERNTIRDLVQLAQCRLSPL
jgi:hypothetical protein